MPLAIDVGVGRTQTFGDWTLTDLELQGDGSLKCAAGKSSGVAESPVTYEPDWVRWSRLAMGGSRPVGCVMVAYLKTGASAGACTAADWLGPVDTFDDNGLAFIDIFSFLLTYNAMLTLMGLPTLVDGSYLALKIEMYKE